MNRIKFINQNSLGEFIDDDNRLVAWGGRDTWQYAWEPELRGPATDGSAAAAATLTSIMEVVPSSVLTFAASSGQTWDGTLTILNWSGSVSGGGTDQLFVGTSAGGLTSTQLAKIVTPTGQTARQLASGEVVLLPKGAMILLK